MWSTRPARCRSRRVRRWSQRAMAARFGLSRRKIRQLVADVAIESNGHLLAGKAV